jgi:CelD/BcsL family acetyltransferase involved in cellulose biosynthesis
VVASHIGFREGSLLHYWFPAYDTRYSKYSPGTALFIELVRCASEHGIEAIDMGFGEQPYKRKQTDVQSDVAFGYASDSGLRRTMYRAGLVRQQFVKSLPMKETLKYVLRRLHPRAGISDFS